MLKSRRADLSASPALAPDGPAPNERGIESIAPSQTHKGTSLESIHYIGRDVHNKTAAYCVKMVNGKWVREGVVNAERKALRQWLAEVGS